MLAHEQIWPWPDVSLDIVLLVLSLIAFLAGIVTFLYEEFCAKSTNHSCYESCESQPKVELNEQNEQNEHEQRPLKVAEPEQKPKAREDLPEPEPEGCDEGKKILEVSLERIPGEAWGLCWHRTAFDEERLIFAGVDPNTPAGHRQQERKAQGLPLLELGDELISVNDVSQHNSMKMALVVSNQLRLKFLRSECMVQGAKLPEERLASVDLPEAYKEVVKEACPPPETLEEPNEIEDDIEDSAEQYNGLQLNFWSYQRPPRAFALTADIASTTVPATPSPPHLRARSDPPKQTVVADEDETHLPSLSRPSGLRKTGTSPTRGSRENPRNESCARSTSRANRCVRTEAIREMDSQMFSGGENSDAHCPSTDWEYMMDNRDGQAMTTAAYGSVVLVAGHQAYPLQTAGVMPCTGLMPPGGMPLQHFGDMSVMPEASSPASGAVAMPMSGFQGYPPGSESGPMVSWNWQAAPQPMEEMVAPQDAEPRTESPPRSKKTYRAGQRLTARRLRAAQRAAAEAAPEPANSEVSDGAEAVEGTVRTKPRRRAGVRVRRRREHALKRREAAEQGQTAEPLPPGLRDAQIESVATEASRDGGASSKASNTTRPSFGGRSRETFMAEAALRQESCEYDIIGEKVLINGLVQAPHLNGHWGHVTDYDPAQRRYAVQVLGAPLLLHLRREVLVLPKTSPPGPEELRGNWQPNLRM